MPSGRFKKVTNVLN